MQRLFGCSVIAVLMASIALGLPPQRAALFSKKGRSISSSPLGTWTVTGTGCASGVITTGNETITVPAGNSGSTDVIVNTGSAQVAYQINAAAFVNATTPGTTNITLANGDTLKFKSTCASSTNCVTCGTNVENSTGTVKDHTTGATLDAISISF